MLQKYRTRSVCALVIAFMPLHGAGAQRIPVLERVSTIGCLDCGTAAQFGEITGVAVSPGGVIWAADRDAPMIRAFRPDGAPIRSFARRGSGPGELTSGARVLLTGNTLYAVDIRTNSVHRFDTLGKFIGRVSLGRFPQDVDVPFGSADLVVLTTQFRPGTNTVERLAAGATETSLKVGPIKDFPSGDGVQDVQSVAVSSKGAIAVGNGSNEYRIRVYDANGKWRDLVRQIPRTRYSAEEIAALEKTRARGAALRSAEGRGSPGAAPPLPKEKSFFPWMALRFDPSDRLWVHTARGNESSTVFDVFDANFNYVGEVRIPQRVRDFAFGGNYVVTDGENDDGVPIVTLWRLK